MFRIMVLGEANFLIKVDQKPSFNVTWEEQIFRKNLSSSLSKWISYYFTRNI